MHWVSSALLAIQVITSLAIIVLVLLQQGKGADMGSSFGSGSAGSLFGSSGAANFLSRTTKWTAVLFFVATIGLAYMSHHTSSSILEGGLMQGFEGKSTPAAGDAVPGAPGAAQQNQGAEVPAAPVVPNAQGSVPAAPESAQEAVPATSVTPQAPAHTPSSSGPATSPDVSASADHDQSSAAVSPPQQSEPVAGSTE